jgi:hypothetical protein
MERLSVQIIVDIVYRLRAGQSWELRHIASSAGFVATGMNLSFAA